MLIVTSNTMRVYDKTNIEYKIKILNDKFTLDFSSFSFIFLHFFYVDIQKINYFFPLLKVFRFPLLLSGNDSDDMMKALCMSADHIT